MKLLFPRSLVLMFLVTTAAVAKIDGLVDHDFAQYFSTADTEPELKKKLEQVGAIRGILHKPANTNHAMDRAMRAVGYINAQWRTQRRVPKSTLVYYLLLATERELVDQNAVLSAPFTADRLAALQAELRTLLLLPSDETFDRSEPVLQFRPSFKKRDGFFLHQMRRHVRSFLAEARILSDPELIQICLHFLNITRPLVPGAEEAKPFDSASRDLDRALEGRVMQRFPLWNRLAEMEANFAYRTATETLSLLEEGSHFSRTLLEAVLFAASGAFQFSAYAPPPQAWTRLKARLDSEPMLRSRSVTRSASEIDNAFSHLPLHPDLPCHQSVQGEQG